MIKNSILANRTQQESLIGDRIYLQNKNPYKKNKILTAPLILTSLVDIFSILVVYLLMNFSNVEDISYISESIKLPSAKNGIEIKRHTIVKFEDGKYFIEENEVSIKELVKELIERQRKSISNTEQTLIVQADKNTKYRYLNNILLAGSQAGYSNIKFVVLLGQPQWLQ